MEPRAIRPRAEHERKPAGEIARGSTRRGSKLPHSRTDQLSANALSDLEATVSMAMSTFGADLTSVMVCSIRSTTRRRSDNQVSTGSPVFEPFVSPMTLDASTLW